jgi:hypothetical protein
LVTVAERVNVENFVRAETNRMFAGLLQGGGGLNDWMHNRVPTPLDQQHVIRMNRDTLYSASVLDISDSADLTLPEHGQRYLSAMVVNQDHYINAVYHDPGDYRLTVDEFGTPYVTVAVRTLVDPADPDDMAAVNALQDQFRVAATSTRPFEMPDYDEPSFTATRTALLELGKGLTSFGDSFGRKDAVDPIRHLIGTAAGWGGLPPQEAYYVGAFPDLPPDGAYQLSVRDVPVDGFWSVSVYNAAGFFPQDRGEKVSVNNVTATPDADGAVTVHFGGSEDLPNRLPIMDGWNYVVRLYQPHPEILDGTWTFPELTASQPARAGQILK